MKRSPQVVLAFLAAFYYALPLALFLQGISPAGSQRTNARQATARELPLLNIRGQGSIVGKEIFVSRTQRIIRYLGIPYAQPPLGKLRFSQPVTEDLPSWNGVKNASRFAPSCPQVANRLKLHEKLYKELLPDQLDLPDPPVSEDCLYLNIYVPDGSRPAEGWPVMVWFHGGDFNTGTPAIWDASVFVSRQKVIVVTVAYRLNILGFFTTTDAEAPGNYGMFDQLAALSWIQKNIATFDGNPSNVVIYGHSSGAISVGLHLLSPLSRGKFAKAIAMSGDALNSVRTPNTEIPVVDIIADRFGCNRQPTSDLMTCLRHVNVTLLVQVSSDIETWGPIIDAETNNFTEPFLPDDPKVILESGNYNAVPLLAGYTKNEQALAYMESLEDEENDGRLSMRKFESIIYDETSGVLAGPTENSTCEFKPEMLAESVLFFYKPHPPTQDEGFLRDRYLDLQTEKNFAAGLTLLAGRVGRQKPSFVYRFDYRPRTQAVTRNVPEWVEVPHMFELPFVWGLPQAPGSKVQWNPSDKAMSDSIMSMLATFVREGNPSLSVIKWEPFTDEQPGILLIDRKIEMSDGGAVDYKALAFWNEYYPRVLEEASNNCCNLTSSGTVSHFDATFNVLLLLPYHFVILFVPRWLGIY